MPKVQVAMIGCGAIALANHVPGLGHCTGTHLAALCDSDPAVLRRASEATGVQSTCEDYREIVARDDIHAVIIATPNRHHAAIALAAIESGKHVLCEKPLAMSYGEARTMRDTALQKGVRHMTAFTYRFVPAMRYMAHLVRSGAIGQPWHFRAQRLQDWDRRSLGWRQIAALAGSGELGDMLSHRIDFGHLLVSRITRVVAQTRRFIDSRQGQPSDAEDWVGIIAEFQAGATGVLESTKLATGRGEGGRSRDYCEVNGSEGTLVYHLETPLTLQVGKRGGTVLEEVAVPKEFLKLPCSSRDPAAGDPVVTFRYDQDAEFIDAILDKRDCNPSFEDGLSVQAVMDAALLSAREGRWADVPHD